MMTWTTLNQKELERMRKDWNERRQHRQQPAVIQLPLPEPPPNWEPPQPEVERKDSNDGVIILDL